MKLANNLKRILKERNLTISSLARGCKVPPTTLANWAAGMPPRNINQLHVVARYLNMSIEDLVFGEPSRSSSGDYLLKKIFEDEVLQGQFEVILRKIKK